MTKKATWNGEKMNMTEWAARFGVSSTYVAQTITKKGGVAPAFAFLASGRKRALPNKLLKYTGPDFTTATGAKIVRGQKETLSGWEKLTGINKYTIRSRAARKNMSFNDALRAPLRKLTPSRSMAPGRFQPRFTTPKPARTKLAILHCRAANPGQRCSECQDQQKCYGKAA